MLTTVQRMFYRHIGVPDITFESRHDSFYKTVNSTTKMEAKEGKTNDKDIFIYGDIVTEEAKAMAGEYGVTEGLITQSDVMEQLEAVTGRAVNVRINSRGGEVFAAIGIYAMLEEARRNGKEVIARVDGIAASAASFVMLAANRIFAHKLSSVMIHRAHSMAVGNAVDFRGYADFLEGQDLKVAALYGERMALSEADVLDLMTRETWYHGNGIITSGLADELLDKGAVSVESALDRKDSQIRSKMTQTALGLA